MSDAEHAEQQRIWGQIAEGWTNWRSKPIKEAEELAAEWKPGRILDIGCGNGRNLLPFARKNFDSSGTDFSAKMIALAKGLFTKAGLEAKFEVAGATELPYPSETFDYCLNIAILHHVKGQTGRSKALSEIHRVLKSNGKALIMVWNKESPKHSQLALAFESAKSKDVYIAWKRKGQVYQRYYYLFDYAELKQFIEKSGFKILDAGDPFDENIKFIIEKV